MATTPAERIEQTPAAPPFQPDPALIGNAEGNDKIRDADRAAAKKYLERTSA